MKRHQPDDWDESIDGKFEDFDRSAIIMESEDEEDETPRRKITANSNVLKNLLRK